jgi:hypothetical protein
LRATFDAGFLETAAGFVGIAAGFVGIAAGSAAGATAFFAWPGGIPVGGPFASALSGTAAQMSAARTAK